MIKLTSILLISKCFAFIRRVQGLWNSISSMISRRNVTWLLHNRPIQSRLADSDFEMEIYFLWCNNRHQVSMRRDCECEFTYISNAVCMACRIMCAHTIAVPIISLLLWFYLNEMNANIIQLHGMLMTTWKLSWKASEPFLKHSSFLSERMSRTPSRWQVAEKELDLYDSTMRIRNSVDVRSVDAFCGNEGEEAWRRRVERRDKYEGFRTCVVSELNHLRTKHGESFYEFSEGRYRF